MCSILRGGDFPLLFPLWIGIAVTFILILELCSSPGISSSCPRTALGSVQFRTLKKKGGSFSLLVMPQVAAIYEPVCLLACPPAVRPAPHPTTTTQANGILTLPFPLLIHVCSFRCPLRSPAVTSGKRSAGFSWVQLGLSQQTHCCRLFVALFCSFYLRLPHLPHAAGLNCLYPITVFNGWLAPS